MSTSLLYHAFGLRNHEYEATEYVGGQISFRFRLRPERLRCAVCGAKRSPCGGR